MATKIPAVAYIRMSSDKQEDSPQQQREEIEALAAGKYRIVRWYQDDGISGAESAKRTGFQRLITDATDRADFAAILCWDQDRFSRFDPIEANYYWHILNQAGVKIVTATQGELDFSDLGGWLTASVTQYGKAQYLRDLSRNVLRARLSNAKQGRWTGNRAPYGYSLEDGKLLLGDSRKVETVQWIFRQYVETDTSLHDLADQLNERGEEPPSGGKKPWQRSSIQTILRREAYIGRASQLRESKGKFYTIRDGSVAPVDDTKAKPEKEWFYVDCPPIVDQELFDKAHGMMKERWRQTTPKRAGKAGLLSGLLVCSHCGKPMVAAWGGNSAPKEERFYQCSSYNGRGKHACNRNLFRESTAIDFLVPKIQDVVLSPRNFVRLTEAIRREILRRQKSAPGNVRSLRGQLAKAEEELKAATKELKRVPDDLYDGAVDEARYVKATRDQLADDMKAAETRQSTGEGDIDRLAGKALSGLVTLRERLKSADPRVARGALKAIVDGIHLEFEHVQHAKIVRSHFKQGTVRFNTCRLDSSDWPEMIQLPGIGETLARRVIVERTENGPFLDLDELTRVRGIGLRTLERVRPYLLPIPKDTDWATLER
ncbi:MAG: recombinase family protein, partial [Planctomycetes bacterium]|nr:recombinase family protein [Planctomycetota bacterium]